ncbi:MAG TPA: hypothetical protein VHZ32_12200, partial [Rhizomicrobium sp.]|nr:hypothetical protein [Rhizomicrobium sp.]
AGVLTTKVNEITTVPGYANVGYCRLAITPRSRRFRRGRAMLNSLLYGLALLGVVFILRFYIDNDGNGQNDGYTGLLAMLAPKGKNSAPVSQQSSKRSFRRKG